MPRSSLAPNSDSIAANSYGLLPEIPHARQSSGSTLGRRLVNAFLSVAKPATAHRQLILPKPPSGLQWRLATEEGTSPPWEAWHEIARHAGETPLWRGWRGSLVDLQENHIASNYLRVLTLIDRRHDVLGFVAEAESVAYPEASEILIYVFHIYRRRGLGKLLLRAAQQLSLFRGSEEMISEFMAGNPGAIGLALAAGVSPQCSGDACSAVLRATMKLHRHMHGCFGWQRLDAGR